MVVKFEMTEKLSLNWHRIGLYRHTLASIGQLAALGGDEKLTLAQIDTRLAPEAPKDWVRISSRLASGLGQDWLLIGVGLVQDWLRNV